MTKKIQKRAPKEPIKLRQKTLADGTQSLYLDCYFDGKRSYEFLKLYLLPGSSATIKAQNDATLTAANTIKLNRILEYTNNKAGLKNTSAKAKQTLAQWMETFRQNQEKKGMKDRKLIHNTIHAITCYNINIALKDIDRNYCIGLINFLRNEYKTAKGEPLKAYTAINYIGCLRNALNYAVREEVLPANPLNQVAMQDKIKAPESKREFLSIEEIHKLEEAPCPSDLIKRAFLFACYCGLRISDIKKLRWKDLTHDGDKYRIAIVMQKTQVPIYMPLSMKAVKWIPERNGDDDNALLFPKLPREVNTPMFITPWMKAAGITKNITFHSSRHTFATMMLTLDVDIYTVSKLLGHTKVETTQIYAKIINKKKENAVELIDNLYSKVESSKQSKAI